MKIKSFYILLMMILGAESLYSLNATHEIELKMTRSIYHYFNSSFHWNTTIPLDSHTLLLSTETEAWLSPFFLSPHWQEWDIKAGVEWRLASGSAFALYAQTMGGVRLAFEFERIIEGSDYSGFNLAPLFDTVLRVNWLSFDLSSGTSFVFFQDGIWLEWENKLQYHFAQRFNISVAWKWINAYLWQSPVHTDNHFFSLGLGMRLKK